MGAVARGMVVLLLVAAVGAAAQVVAPMAPAGIAYDAQGDLFIADAARNQVYESSVGGVLSVVAGTGVQGFGGDGGAAVGAMLNRPMAVAVGADGTLYIADTGNERVRAVSPAGVMSTVAGDGVRGFAGDGGVATAAELDEPSGVAVGVGGALLIADRGNRRVRAVSAAEVMSTFAGNGVEGFTGDGGAATAAEFAGPVAVACGSDGRVFVVDARNERVRVIASDGTIATFAGTGVAGFSGDGGTATAARLFGPRGVAVLPDGGVLIADDGNRRVRLVGVDGVITTIAGDGVQGLSADGAVGTAGSLNEARAVGASGFGAPVFADVRGRLVRALLGNGDVYGAAGLVAARTSVVSAVVPVTVVYGSGSAGVVVSGVAGTPMGMVSLVDAGRPVGSGVLVGGKGSFALGGLVAGTHSVSVAYGGDGFNPAAVSGVAAVVVTQASTVTGVRAVGGYAGLPMTLTAMVAPEFAGVPTGMVVFEDGGSVVASAQVVGGVATGVYLAPVVGVHSIMAVYSGDGNFSGSASGAVTATVGAVPDFAVAVSGMAAQTMQVGAVATYVVHVSALSGAFSSAVSLSASGLPAGTAVTFSPGLVVPGTGGVDVTMSVPTAGLLAQRGVGGGVMWAWLLPVGVLVFVRRRRVLVLGAMVMLVGCGTRTVSDAAAVTRSYTIHVTGTATSLAGSVLTHAVDVSLTVE